MPFSKKEKNEITQEQRDAIENAIALVEQDGGVISEKARDLMEQVARGEMTTDQAIEIIKAKY